MSQETQRMVDLVEIEKIEQNRDFLMRETIDKNLVATYKENLQAILESSPIIVYDTPNGFLLADGFHRIKAARQLNWEKIRAEIRKGSVQDAFAYACIANLKHGKPLKPKERKRAIDEFIKLNVNLSNYQIAFDVGVSEITIRRYRQALEFEGEIETQQSRMGMDGKERVMPTATNVVVDAFNDWFENHVSCGDIFEELPKDTRKYDLIIVDPPYGITEQIWDKETKFDLLNFTRRWLNLVLQKLKPSGRLYVFWSREYMFELKPLFDEIQNEYPLNFGGMIVWNYRNVLSMPNNRHKFKITWEPIFYFYGMEAEPFDWAKTEITAEKWEGDEQSDVWTFAIPQSNFQDKRIHPTQKPLDLYKRIISTSSKANDLVLDPFAGSGTTGHAAYTLGREFKLIEKNPEYHEKIRVRLKEVFKNGE